MAALLAAWMVLRLQTEARATAGVENLAVPPGESWWLVLNSARYVVLHVYHVVNPWLTFGVRVPDLPAEHAASAAAAWAVLVAALAAAVWAAAAGVVAAARAVGAAAVPGVAGVVVAAPAH